MLCSAVGRWGRLGRSGPGDACWLSTLIGNFIPFRSILTFRHVVLQCVCVFRGSMTLAAAMRDRFCVRSTTILSPLA